MNPGFLNAFRSRPLAFLNACDVGGAEISLAGLGNSPTHSSNSTQPRSSLHGGRFRTKKYMKSPRCFIKPPSGKCPSPRSCSPFAPAPTNEEPETADTFAAYCFYGDPMARAEKSPLV